jgi:hypothetical protein
MYSISYGARTSHVRAMIEKHLSVDDDVVKRKTVYRVAYHHWPELLILRNMNENRSISKLISREEAGNYGNEFVNSSELPNYGTLDDSIQMHVQAPTVSEIDVSRLVASLYRTPKKPAAVDCGVSFSFPFSVDEPSNQIPFPKSPSKSTAKSAFECSLPYFPSNLFNNSPSIRQLPPAMLPPTQPASNDPPSNDPVNLPPASEFISVDASNDFPNTNTELPTCPTPIDCCVQPAESNTNPTIDCCVPTNTDQPTPIDCCVPIPDSPDFKLPVNVCHEYIKRKVLQHGIGQELLTSKFYDCIEQLQRIHVNFDPIVCQYGNDFKNAYVYPCPNVHQRNHDACQFMTIRLILKKKGKENDVYCQTCARLARNRLVDVNEKRRTAPDSRVPIAYLSIDELHEKMGRLQQDRKNLMRKNNYMKVSRAQKKIMQEDLL